MLIERYYTAMNDKDVSMKGVLDDVDWQCYNMDLQDGSEVNVEFPANWSEQARTIVSNKYFRMIDGQRERSLRSVIERVVNQIVQWGWDNNYFVSTKEQLIFEAELAYVLVHQKACFNSPVLFNVGVPDREPQVSACFLTEVEDTLESILDHTKVEGMIFKGGSGSGVNVSTLRREGADLTAGGTSSGPISFMKSWDASANAIKSGGTTRRAARMVVMNATHPDIIDFAESKVVEEEKAHALVREGYDGGLNGAARDTVAFQNANHSVLISDDFMAVAVSDPGSRQAEVLDAVANAAWACGDPGLLFKNAINNFHTTKADGPISVVNPCSEFQHHAWTSCNLSSIDVAKLGSPGSQDKRGFDGRPHSDFWLSEFEHVVKLMATAQDICITGGSYPHAKIAFGTVEYRPIGIGFSNLGGLLMMERTPYDSDEGRAIASYVSGYMTLFAYEQSIKLARRLKPFPAYERNRNMVMDSLARQGHQPIVQDVHGLAERWSEMVESGSKDGYRNSYVTNIAPVGTISFWMDNDTTGVEPEIALTKTKELVGGGALVSASTAIERSVYSWYAPEDAEDILAYVSENNTFEGAPYITDEDRELYLTALPDARGNALSPEAHIKMLAAVQPFLSGGISKTVNCPEWYTSDDIKDLYVTAWKAGIKSLAVYRDNSKMVQPVTQGTEYKKFAAGYDPATDSAVPLRETGDEPPFWSVQPKREKLPADVRSRRHKFNIGMTKGYIHVGEYEDGRPAELFLRVNQQGSTVSGWADSFSKAVSLLFQLGCPLEEMCEMFLGVAFDPAGFTGNQDVPQASSVVDYVFKWLQKEYGQEPVVEEVEATPTRPYDGVVHMPQIYVVPGSVEAVDTGATCQTCGGTMKRTGTCLTCDKCGDVSGGCG